MNKRQNKNFGRLNKLLKASNKTGLILITKIIEKILLDVYQNSNRNSDVKETDTLLDELKALIENN